MNYTIPPISNQQLSKEKPCVVKAKINGGERIVLAQNWQLFHKILVDGEQIPFSEDNTKLIYTLPEGSHDIHYYIKPWEVHNHNYPEYKGQYILYLGHFYGVGLTHITIPDNVVAITSSTFNFNTAWEQETLEIPENVKEIGPTAFSGFHGNVVIHTSDNLKISSGFSSYVNNLTFLGTGDIEVTNDSRYPINGNLTFDRQNVTFNGIFNSVNGEEINFGNGNITFENSTGNGLMASTIKRIIFGNGNVTMRNSGGRFTGCSALETLTFGNGDIEIDSGNFQGCTSLKKIDFGKKGNLTIGSGNFGGLTSLEEIRFPDGLTTFNQGGNFYGAPRLKSVKLPNLKTAANIGAVTPFSASTDLEIGSADILGATNNYTSTSFTNVKNLTIHRGKIGNYAFKDNPLQSLTLGDVEISEYAFASTGTDAGYEAKLSNSITKIGVGAFAGARLTKINIPITLKEISTSCFASTWLTEVEIPASVAIIGETAFSNTPIGKLTLNKGLRRIENSAFYSTTMFDLVIPETVEYIGRYAFASNSANNYLTNLTINMKQGKIDDYAFSNCTELQNLTIYPGVEELGDGAFQSATDLIKLYIPGTVKKIGSGCFRGFGSLRGQGEIILEEGIKQLLYEAFYNGVISMNLILPNSIEYLGSSCLPNIKNIDDARIITYNPNPPEKGGSMNSFYVPNHLAPKYSAKGYNIQSL